MTSSMRGIFNWIVPILLGIALFNVFFFVGNEEGDTFEEKLNNSFMSSDDIEKQTEEKICINPFQDVDCKELVEEVRGQGSIDAIYTLCVLQNQQAEEYYQLCVASQK